MEPIKVPRIGLYLLVPFALSAFHDYFGVDSLGQRIAIDFALIFGLYFFIALYSRFWLGKKFRV